MKYNMTMWISKAKALMKGLSFSTLDAATQTCVNNEMFYFNNRRLAVAAWAVLVIEIMNMLNVLLFSKSGLGTENNRQYFYMYLLLFVSGAGCLMVRCLFREKQIILRGCYVCLALIWVLWNAVLTAMDFRHNQNITVFVTSIIGIAFMVRMLPWQTLFILPSGLFMLLLCTWDMLDDGAFINAVIVTLIAIFISCSRYFNTLEEIGYRKKMVIQADHRTVEKQRLYLLQEQQTALLKLGGNFLFIWDRELDSLTFSGDRHISFEDEQQLREWLSAWNPKILIENCKDQLGVYMVEAMPQLDYDQVMIGAVGRLTYIEKKQ